jgi:RNA polymerase sigma factor (sigma-70 family)
MPTEATRPLARHMIAAVLRHGVRDGPTDRDLLVQFVADRAEDAFAELVRRHGAMVLAVCRRVTGHAQDAEDAFQAAFMVLARRAGHVNRPELLGNWLYGVAYRTALEARTARRRVKEQLPVSEVPELAAPSADDDSADLRRVIDEELAKLPEKYRAAVVLCDLEGLCRKDAAGRLRIPEGTLSSRLAYARKVLAGRLTRRGLTASAGAIATALGSDAAATTVPHQLILFTARAATRTFAGGMVPPDVLSNRVTSLTDGVMKAMIVTRLRLMAGAGMVALSLIGLGAAAVIGQSSPDANARKWVFVQVQDNDIQPPASNPKEKVKLVENKFVAKGIADDEVPYASVPMQAVVRYEDGKLVVRQRTRSYVAVVGSSARAAVEGNPSHSASHVTTFEVRSTIAGKSTDAADVAVFDMKGNRVPDKTWKEKLKTDQHVLVSQDGKLPHPRELALFKDDTLLIVLPSHGAEVGLPTSWPFPNRRSQGPNDFGYNELQWGEPFVRPSLPPAPSMPASPKTPAPASEVPAVPRR